MTSTEFEDLMLKKPCSFEKLVSIDVMHEQNYIVVAESSSRIYQAFILFDDGLFVALLSGDGRFIPAHNKLFPEVASRYLWSPNRNRLEEVLNSMEQDQSPYHALSQTLFAHPIGLIRWKLPDGMKPTMMCF